LQGRIGLGSLALCDAPGNRAVPHGLGGGYVEEVDGELTFRITTRLH
jgi:hypothetical protein